MKGRRYIIYCFMHCSAPFSLTGLLEAVADLCIVFLMCFVIYLVWLGSPRSAGELIILTMHDQVSLKSVCWFCQAVPWKMPDSSALDLISEF